MTVPTYGAILLDPTLQFVSFFLYSTNMQLCNLKIISSVVFLVNEL